MSEGINAPDKPWQALQTFNGKQSRSVLVFNQLDIYIVCELKICPFALKRELTKPIIPDMTLV